MDVLSFSCDYSSDLLAKMNPGVISMNDYTEFLTPDDIQSDKTAFLIARKAAVESFDENFLKDYGDIVFDGTTTLNDLFDANTEVIQINSANEVPTPYPNILNENAESLYNFMRFRGNRSVSFKYITFYLVVCCRLTSSDTVDPITDSFFIVFHYINN